MKTITICILTTILLVGLTTMVLAQNNLDAARQKMYQDIVRQSMRYDLLYGMNALHHVTSTLSYDENFREELGVTKEQTQKIQEATRLMSYQDMQNDSEFKPLLDEMEGKFNPYHPNATEETLKKFADLQSRISEMTTQKFVSRIYDNLTPNQIQRVKEFQISSMSETEFVFPGMFEALGLSDEQKKQFDEIPKKMDLDIEKHIDKMMEYRSKYDEKIQEKLKNVSDPQEKEKLRMDIIRGNDIAKQIWAELQPEEDAKMKSGKELADKLKVEMFDVLTDEQWDRMLGLIDNPPEYVKKVIAQTRKWREESKNNKPEVWKPGPNSWQPGDPIPEAYRIERNEKRNFPRPKTE